MKALDAYWGVDLSITYIAYAIRQRLYARLKRLHGKEWMEYAPVHPTSKELNPADAEWPVNIDLVFECALV